MPTLRPPPSRCRDNNFIKDFPQLADGLMVIPLPVEEQCRGVLSEPFPNLQLLTGSERRSRPGLKGGGGGGSISQKEWSHQPGLLCTRTHSHWTLQTLTLNPSFHPFIPPSTVPHTHSDIWLQTPTSAPIIPPLAKLAFSPR